MIWELNQALSNLLFYGSDEIYQKIMKFEYKEEKLGIEFNQIIIAMIKDIDKNRKLKVEDIFSFKVPDDKKTKRIDNSVKNI